MHFVAITHPIRRKLAAHGLRVLRGIQIDAQHGALFVRLQPLNFDVTQCRSGKDTARQVERFSKILFAAQFINRGAPHHAVHGHLRADRRHQQRVAIFEVLQIAADAVQQQVVDIHLFHKLPATRVANQPKRPTRGDAPCSKQCVERRREGADVIGARRCHLAHHVDSYGAETPQRNVSGHVPVLSPKDPLHDFLHFSERSAAHQKRPRFGQ